MLANADFKLIGHAGVDSGTLFVGDPCYVDDDKHTFYGWNDNPKCSALFSDEFFEQQNPSAEIKEGVVFSTVHGDGNYGVYHVLVKGKVVGVFVDIGCVLQQGESGDDS